MMILLPSSSSKGLSVKITAKKKKTPVLHTGSQEDDKGC